MGKRNLWALTGLLFIGLFMACTDEVEEVQLSPQKIELTVAERAIVNNQQEFGVKLLAALYKQENGRSDNLLISPFSVYCALGMLTNGAEGETKVELLRVLGQEDYKAEELDVFARKMVQGLKTIDSAVVFKTANSIWSDKQVVLKDDFVRLNKEQYEAEAFRIDFSDPSVVAQINNWCSKHTEGKIPEMIQEVSQDVIAYLLNAVYFKARWNEEFMKDQTVGAPFHLENGQTIEVPFMMGDIVSSYNQNELFASLSLAYSTGTYHMHVVVPAEQASLSQVVDAIGQPGYLSKQLKWSPRSVQVSLPRFEVKADYELKEVLRSLGIESAFNMQDAEFGALTDQDFFVSKVKQSASLKVDEEGSEGAAVTLIAGATSSLFEKAVFKADRPFLFFITENETGVILFAGKVGRP